MEGPLNQGQVHGPLRTDRSKCTVLIISFTDLRSDARVRRQVETLAPFYDVITAALAPSCMENRHITVDRAGPHIHLPVPIRKAISLWIRLRRQLLRKVFRAYELDHWEPFRKHILSRLQKVNADVIVSNDLETLPLAMLLARSGSRVIFDAHEFSPRQHDDDPQWVAENQRSNEYLCRKFMPQADACFTVGDGIAVAYGELTGVTPQVLLNAPAYVPLEPSSVDPARIKIVHHGIIDPRRRILEMIQMMDELVLTHDLHIYGHIPPDAYGSLVKDSALKRTNVFLHPPVPPASIPREISQYDIGIHPLRGISFNHRYALPNKLFDFIQARLALVVGPNPEMARLVTDHGIGVVTADHDMTSFLKAIRSMTVSDIRSFKDRSNKAAAVLNAENNMDLLRTCVRSLCRTGK